MELIHHMLIENEHICLNIWEDFFSTVWGRAARFIKSVQAVDVPVMVFARWKSITLSPYLDCASDMYKSHTHTDTHTRIYASN